MAEQTPSSTTPPAVDHVVIDLGKQKRKRIKALRKGKGKLMARVQEAIANLKESGALKPNAAAIVVVRQKRKKSFSLF